jgi:hypothetical protein
MNWNSAMKLFILVCSTFLWISTWAEEEYGVDVVRFVRFPRRCVF